VAQKQSESMLRRWLAQIASMHSTRLIQKPKLNILISLLPMRRDGRRMNVNDSVFLLQQAQLDDEA
jgi:hypothetical protein